MKKLEIKQEWYRPSYWIKKRKTISIVEDRAITYTNEFMNMLLSMFKYDIVGKKKEKITKALAERRGTVE